MLRERTIIAVALLWRLVLRAILAGYANLDPAMPSKPKKKKPVKARARAPKGKRQVLIIMSEDVVKLVKVAAVEDDIKMSHAVEEAVREWLDKRKRAMAR